MNFKTNIKILISGILIGLAASSRGQNIKIENTTDDDINQIVVLNHSSGAIDSLSYSSKIRLKKKIDHSLIFLAKSGNQYLVSKSKKVKIEEDNLYAYKYYAVEDVPIDIYFNLENNTEYVLCFLYVKPNQKKEFKLLNQHIQSGVVNPGKSSKIKVYLPIYDRNWGYKVLEKYLDLKVIGINASGKLKEFQISRINIEDTTIEIRDTASKQ